MWRANGDSTGQGKESVCKGQERVSVFARAHLIWQANDDSTGQGKGRKGQERFSVSRAHLIWRASDDSEGQRKESGWQGRGNRGFLSGVRTSNGGPTTTADCSRLVMAPASRGAASALPQWRGICTGAHAPVALLPSQSWKVTTKYSPCAEAVRHHLAWCAEGLTLWVGAVGVQGGHIDGLGGVGEQGTCAVDCAAAALPTSAMDAAGS